MVTGDDGEEERKGVVIKSGWCVCVCAVRGGKKEFADWRVEVQSAENCRGTRKRGAGEERKKGILINLFLFLCLFAAPTCVPVWWWCSCASTKPFRPQFGLNSKQVSCTLSLSVIIHPSSCAKLTGGAGVSCKHLHLFVCHWPHAPMPVQLNSFIPSVLVDIILFFFTTSLPHVLLLLVIKGLMNLKNFCGILYMAAKRRALFPADQAEWPSLQ